MSDEIPFSMSVIGDVLDLTIAGKSAKVKIPKGERGASGRDGISIKGEKGDRGDQGIAGRDSHVAGPKGDKGDTGETGSRGLTPSLSIGSVTVGETANVILSGTDEKPVLHFILPRGERGIQGVAGMDGKHGNHEYIDLLYMGNSPRFSDDWCGKHVIVDGVVSLPEMTEGDIGRWVTMKTFTDLAVNGIVEEVVKVEKNVSAKFVVIGYGGKFLFTRF